MNAIVKRWQGISLILRILVGLILGAVLGVVAPNLTILTILGDIFVGALKAVAPVLVFVLVIASLANASVGIGNRFRTVVVLYMLTTFL
ncbi:MAG: cation:dicarboxylase symporter family transporter, partial [Firmicutes bacterium]|nr:cation:dicarboxylase symporter family transporter [Bacillota bacterium]